MREPARLRLFLSRRAPGEEAEYPPEVRLPAPFSDYAVTSAGEVVSYKRGRRLVLQAQSSAKYPKVTLYPDAEWANLVRPQHGRVHRLVALAYHGPEPVANAVVTHLDGDPNNARPENLAWSRVDVNQLDFCFHRAAEYVREMRGLGIHPDNAHLRPAIVELYEEVLDWVRSGAIVQGTG